MSYVVTATFRVKAGERTRFAEKIAVHAAASLAEAGCRVFDVCQSSENPDIFLLYEVYRDPAAYLSHRESAHYTRFREWAPPLLVHKEGEIFQSRHIWKNLTIDEGDE